MGNFLAVLRRFLRIFRRCPLMAASDVCRFFFTNSEVRSGHELKNPALIALIHVDLTRLNAALRRYVTVSCFFLYL